MALASQMKTLSEEILTSFKQRIKENEELVNNVQKTLDGFHKDQEDMAAALRAGFDKGEKTRLKEADILMKEMIKDHKEMAAALRGSLAKDEKNRLSEFKALMGSIINEISEIFTSTQTLLTKFDKEHQEMAAALRSDLDEGEKIRIQEFIALIKSIKEEISEIFADTQTLLTTLDKEHKEMAAALRSDLDEGEVNRMKEFAVLMKSINEEILRIFSYTNDLLAKFDKEHQEMSVELRKDLANGEVERIKEYNEVMKGIQNDVKILKKAVAELLGDFAQDREGASAAWKKMSDILAQLRKTGVTPPKEVKKEDTKKAVPVIQFKDTPVEAKVKATVEVKVKAPVEVKVKAPVEAKAKAPVVAKVKTPITLEEKVLNYINNHPKGVKVAQMEEPLGETRMKIGYTAKVLLDEKKVKKFDNVYFPLV